MIRNKIKTVFFITIIFMIFGCPPKGDPGISKNTSIDLLLNHQGTFSLTLKLAVEDTTCEWSYSLFRNKEEISIGVVYSKDTLIQDTDLLPGTVYEYKAFWVENGEYQDSSNSLIINTLDTTSHNFIWTFDTLGNPGSQLTDVKIINDSDIYAVGLVRTDSGNFNYAHWDGIQWNFLNIQNFQEVVMQCVNVFNHDDIWVGNGGTPHHWNGEEWTWHFWQDEGIIVDATTDLWGNSSGNMYFVGRDGGIVHFDGSDFSIMESNTSIWLRDIVGNHSGDLFVTGYSTYQVFGSVFLKYSEGLWNTIFSSGAEYWPNGNEDHFGYMLGLDVYNDTTYIYSKAGVIRYNNNDGGYLLNSEEDNSFHFDYHTLKAQSSNDIIMFSTSGRTFHYNGINWKKDTGTWIMGNGNYYIGGDYKDNIAIVVGQLAQFGALIVTGRR